jgi:hypothetical protein
MSTIDYKSDTRIGGVVSSVCNKYPIRAHERRAKKCTLPRSEFADSRLITRAAKENVNIAKRRMGKWSHWGASTDGNHPAVR